MVQVQTVLNGQQALFALSQKSLPAKVSYRIGKAINQSKSVARAFDEARRNYCLSLDLPISEDKQSFITEGREKEVGEGIQKLLDAECDTKFMPVSLASLGDIQIEPIHLAALDGWILTEPAEVDTDAVDRVA